ncbi:MAG: SDR family NAD(P)-dependent oxidoreductase [Acidimicrobiales bacterium]
MDELGGKVALVTGGASGIGAAVSRLLADRGAQVLVVDVDPDGGRRVADELGGTFMRADVSRPEDFKAVIDLAVNHLGGIDIAHLNAGVLTGEASIVKLSDTDYRRILGANVDGVVFGLRAVVPVMAEAGGGAIVVTASLAGLVPFSADPIYAMTKHAVIGLVRSLPPQLDPLSIRINAVCPGLVDTPLVDVHARKLLDGAGFPLITAEAVAGAVLGCIVGSGPAASTGQAIVVQPGAEPVVYRFGNAPGPRASGSEGRVPPEIGFAR